jgi:hypothetical protein
MRAGHSQSGHVRTGASGSGQATAWALNALICLVCTVLPDAAGGSLGARGSGGGAETAASTIAALERMRMEESPSAAISHPSQQAETSGYFLTNEWIRLRNFLCK